LGGEASDGGPRRGDDHVRHVAAREDLREVLVGLGRRAVEPGAARDPPQPGGAERGVRVRLASGAVRDPADDGAVRELVLRPPGAADLLAERLDALVDLHRAELPRPGARAAGVLAVVPGEARAITGRALRVVLRHRFLVSRFTVDPPDGAGSDNPCRPARRV